MVDAPLITKFGVFHFLNSSRPSSKSRGLEFTSKKSMCKRVSWATTGQLTWCTGFISLRTRKKLLSFMIHLQIACSLDNYITWCHNSEQNWFVGAESLQERKEVEKLDFCRLFSDTWLHASHWSAAHISLVHVAWRSLVNFSYSIFRGRMPRYMANLCQSLRLFFDLLHGSHDSRVPI